MVLVATRDEIGDEVFEFLNVHAIDRSRWHQRDLRRLHSGYLVARQLGDLGEIVGIGRDGDFVFILKNDPAVKSGAAAAFYFACLVLL